MQGKNLLKSDTENVFRKLLFRLRFRFPHCSLIFSEFKECIAYYLRIIRFKKICKNKYLLLPASVKFFDNFYRSEIRYS